MQKIAVVLSGCGVMDGSEIHEATLTLFFISKAGCTYQCMAPDISQQRVWNHLKNAEMSQTRNTLGEAARIARGDIIDIARANARDYDAVIFPGGFGAALNLCDFASKGSNMNVQADVLRFTQAMALQKKPAGYICIAPVMIPKIYGPDVRLTIGNDLETISVIKAMGGLHVNAVATEIVVDETHKVVSVPAYMCAKNIAEVGIAVEKLVNQVISFTR